MTRKISELPVEDLVGRFQKAQENQDAVREQNIPAANRQVDITMRTAEVLMKSAEEARTEKPDGSHEPLGPA
ncbi:MAG: hypothetical protein H6892_03390 [Brucellaceae bacterium]|nr:hypothetical protein [Brucellaceae bacterium]